MCGSRSYIYFPSLYTTGCLHKALQRRTLRGHPHGNAFLCNCTCFALFWLIVQMDPVNAVPVNALFWNLVSGWKNPKMLPLRSHLDSESAYFAYWWRHHPIPRPLAFNLLPPQCLIIIIMIIIIITTTTTTTVDYMLVFVLQKILSFTRLVVESESQQ